MATVTGTPYSGPLTIDLTDVKDDLVDLEPGARQRLRTEQEGMPGVVDELANSMPVLGDKAGISPAVYQRFVQRTELLAKLRKKANDLAKALEVVTESEAKIQHDRENDVSIMVDSVKSTAKRTGDTTLLAGYEKTIKYNAQTAEKAAQTRKKNADAKAEAEKNEGEKGGG